MTMATKSGLAMECGKRSDARTLDARSQLERRAHHREVGSRFIQARGLYLDGPTWDRAAGLPPERCRAIAEEVASVLGVNLQERMPGRPRLFGYPASRARGAAAMLMRLEGAMFKQIAGALRLSIGGVATAVQNWDRYLEEIGRVVEARGVNLEAGSRNKE